MDNYVRRQLIRISLFISLFMIPILPLAANAQLIDYPLKTGPFVDKIVYNVITQDDQQVLALQDGDIDLIGDMVDPSFLDTLSESNYIEVANTMRNGYGYLTINCAKYPLNITAFRRAFAFALDKEAISDDVWGGLSVPQDSCVPRCNPFSIEGHLLYNYYTANITLANQLLDGAGFLDVDSDGFREAPDGSDFDVEIYCPQSSNIAIEVCNFSGEALQEIGVDVFVSINDWYDYNPWWPPWGGDYDMVFLGSSFYNFDVDWLAYDFWSEYADEPYWNIPNFKNATYDSWRDQLLHALTYEDVYEAAIEMQKIWVYECPMVITYENILLTAYRVDRFDGFVNDVHDGIPSWWTNYKVHLMDEMGGPFGGTLCWSNPLDLDTFNFMISSSTYTMNVLQMIYDSLIRPGPDGVDVPWLASSYRIETHTDNPSITDGHTRITFDLIQNATWSDGTPLTGEDVAFTLNYYRDTPGNPYGADLYSLMAAYAPNPYSAVAEFETESYWHLHTVGYKPIIPKHVFQHSNYSEWNLWNPDPPNDAMVTSGPFNVSEYVAGEYVELTYNPNYFFGPYIPPHQETETTLNLQSDWIFNIGFIPLTSAIVTSTSIAVIMIVLVLWKLETRRLELPQNPSNS